MDQSSRILGSPNLIYILFSKLRGQPPPLKSDRKIIFIEKLKKKIILGGSRVFLGVKLIPP